MQKILVTGGCGFIGSHVVDILLKRGYEVYVIDDLSTGSMKNLTDCNNTRLKIILCDIARSEVKNIIQDIKPEIIMLIAAQASVKVSMRDPILDAQSNIIGLVNILEAGRKVGCKKVIFASSGGTIYGEVTEDKLPIKEDQELEACSFYGLTKMTAIGYLKIYKKVFDMNYVALALGNVYGPRQSADGESGVIAIFAKKILNGNLCVINGDGKTTRDYVYVEDVAEAFVSSIDKGTGLINIGRGEETSVYEIFNVLLKSLNKSSEVDFGPCLNGEVRRVCLDPAKAIRELEWFPKVSLEDGVKKVLDWLKLQS